MMLVLQDHHPSSSSVFPIQGLIELPRTVFPTRGLQLGVHASFVREEPLGLRCLTKILAMCVEDNVSINLDILTLEC